MPELPEVETTCRGIAPHLLGRRISAARIHERRLRWPIPAALAAEITGQRVHTIARRAKYLLIGLERGTLILHLGMSGSLRVLPIATPRISHDHYDLEFDSGHTLRFNDPRRFGCLLHTQDDPALHPLLARLAPEPLECGFTAEYLHRVTRRRRVAIKLLLLNGQLITGVGNIYASEALFRARIRPRRQARSLTLAECRQLVRAVQTVLRLAIRVGGTTLRDFVRADGTPGEFRTRLNVYERDGRPCRVCRTPIRHFVQGGRSTYYCPKCQR